MKLWLLIKLNISFGWTFLIKVVGFYIVTSGLMSLVSPHLESLSKCDAFSYVIKQVHYCIALHCYYIHIVLSYIHYCNSVHWIRTHCDQLHKLNCCVSVCVDFAERRFAQLLFLGFGVLCMIQAILNISLRLACEYGLWYCVIWYFQRLLQHHNFANVVVCGVSWHKTCHRSCAKHFYLFRYHFKKGDWIKQVSVSSPPVYSNEESPPSNCNTTQFTDQKEVGSYCHQKRPGCNCNRLQERFNALIGERDRLRNTVSELNNKIRMVEEERDRLKLRLGGEKKSSLQYI